MTAAEILILARAYAAGTGLALSAVSKKATATNDKLFDRLAAGRGANILTIERAAGWFHRNWPPDVPWPAEVPRRECVL